MQLINILCSFAIATSHTNFLSRNRGDNNFRRKQIAESLRNARRHLEQSGLDSVRARRQLLYAWRVWRNNVPKKEAP